MFKKINVTELQYNAFKLSFKNNKLTYFLYFLITLLSTLSLMSGPLLFSNITDKLQSNYNSSLIAILIVTYALSLALNRFLNEFKTVQINKIEQSIKLQSAKNILLRITNLRAGFFSQYNNSAISSMIQNYHYSNKILLQVILGVFLVGFTEILLSFALIANQVNLKVGAFVLFFGVLTIFITYKSNIKTAESLRLANKVSVKSSNFMGGVLSSLNTIKVYNALKWALNRFDCLNFETREHWSLFYKTRFQYGSVLSLLYWIQIAMVLLMTFYSTSGADTTQKMILVGFLLIQLNRPFELIASSMKDFMMAGGLAEPLDEAIKRFTTSDIKQTALSSFDSCDEIKILNYLPSFAATECEATPVNHTFKIGHLNFIVGSSGAGKTTLLNSIVRLDEGYSGIISSGNIDILLIKKQEYYSALGYVPQDYILINSTLKDNICLGREFSDDEVWVSLDKVGLASKFRNIHEGLNFVIGENGSKLSGGERQRLAIARAIVYQPKLLIFDEASSALDNENEGKIYDVLRDFSNKTLVLVVTHKKSFIKDGDCVLDLSKKN